mmetsp:Transcript_9349/g.19307  ORF Transcript_9349/g.19307 Transcript_9349/m.19307 type:complete len:331 (+) Transcript_9349:323-1315(+)
MAARKLERVVVVVPPLPKRQNAHPPVIPGQVAGVVLLVPPHVARRVHEPGDVMHPTHAEGERPHECLPAAEQVCGDPRCHNVPSVCFLQELVEGLLLQVRGVGAVADAALRGRVVEEPAAVAPPEALVRCVRVVRGVRVEVVVPVRADPLDGVPLHGEGAAVGKEVLQPLGGVEALVCELPVVGQRDAEHPRDHPPHEHHVQVCPGEAEGRVACHRVHGGDETAVHNVLLLPLATQELGALSAVHDVRPPDLLQGVAAGPLAAGRHVPRCLPQLVRLLDASVGDTLPLVSLVSLRLRFLWGSLDGSPCGDGLAVAQRGESLARGDGNARE